MNNTRRNNLINTVNANENTAMTNTYTIYTLQEIEEILEIGRLEAINLVLSLQEKGFVRRRPSRYGFSSVVNVRNVRQAFINENQNGLLMAA